MTMSSLAAGTDLGEAGLLLVGHGSTLNADSSGPTHRQAERIRRRGVFAEVRTCFWKEQPVISAALRGFFSRRVFVVPLFISDGYFTDEIIPRELGWTGSTIHNGERARQIGDRNVIYCEPVGTFPGMEDVILARAATALAESPGMSGPPMPADCSLFIAGHGTSRHENSRRAIEFHAGRIAQRGIYHDVHGIFMEEAPRIHEAYGLAQTGNLVVVPFFIADGLHSQEDIPVLLGATTEDVQSRLGRGEAPWQAAAEIQGKRVWYGRSVGDEPVLAEVILERVRQVAGSGDGIGRRVR